MMKIAKTSLTTIQLDDQELQTLDIICRLIRCVTDRTDHHEKVSLFLRQYVSEPVQIRIEGFIKRIFDIKW